MSTFAMERARRIVRCALLAVFAGSACAGVQVHENGRALVVIECEPPHALVTVDGAAVGRLDLLGGAVRVAAAASRLEISAPGYLVYREDLDIEPGATYDLRVELWPCFPDVDPGCIAASAAPDPGESTVGDPAGGG